MNVSKDQSCSRNLRKKNNNKQTVSWTTGRYLEDLRKPQISFLLWQNAVVLKKKKRSTKNVMTVTFST